MGRYILIVDDHRDTVDSLATLLTFNGFSPLRAYDGEEALAIAARERPGVVLLDMNMPGVDGCEVCRRLRAQPWGKDMLIVAISGSGKRQDALAAGCDEHLVKPARLARLLEVMASAPMQLGLA